MKVPGSPSLEGVALGSGRRLVVTRGMPYYSAECSLLLTAHALLAGFRLVSVHPCCTAESIASMGTLIGGCTSPKQVGSNPT